jgi:hypothetical protein
VIIDERIADDGALLRTLLELDGDRLLLRDGDRPVAALPPAAVVAVMQRYGRPLEPGLEPEPAALELGAGIRLRFRARVDADSRDYLVLEQAGGDPLAAMAGSVAEALRFLAR